MVQPTPTAYPQRVRRERRSAGPLTRVAALPLSAHLTAGGQFATQRLPERPGSRKLRLDSSLRQGTCPSHEPNVTADANGVDPS
jgi:hypothetical protein